MMPILALALASPVSLAAFSAHADPNQLQSTVWPEFGGVPLVEYNSGTKVENIVGIGANNALVYCPSLGCIPTGSPNGEGNNIWTHAITSALFSSETRDEGVGQGAQFQQNTVSIDTRVNSGAVKAWATETDYVAGDNIKITNASGSGDRTYAVLVGGSTGQSAPAPTDTSGNAFLYDGGPLKLQWINYGATTAQAGLYNATKVEAGGQPAWAQANNMDIAEGYRSPFVINTELDFTNNSGMNCGIGQSSCIALLITPKGNTTSTAGISVGTKAQGSDTPALIWGMRLGSAVPDNWFARDAMIEMGAPAAGTNKTKRGLAINGLNVNAEFSETQILLNAEAPRALHITGDSTTASIEDSSNSPIGIKLGGVYEDQQIEGTNFSVGAAGGVTGAAISSGSFFRFLNATTVSALNDPDGLPCNANRKGELRRVDGVSNPNAFRAAPLGGGSASSLVYCDGSTWHISG